jgi:transposase
MMQALIQNRFGAA